MEEKPHYKYLGSMYSNNTNDMLLVNLPWSDLVTPPVAPALLKGIAESHGYSIKTKDFNCDLKEKFCNDDQNLYEEVQDYFLSQNEKNYKYDTIIRKFYDHIMEYISKENFRYFGISVFSVYTQKSTFELCQLIRKKFPEIKIVLGGRGLNIRPHYSIMTELDDSEKRKNLSNILIDRDLCDYTIIGDAEDKIIDLFEGNLGQKDLTWYVPNKKDLSYPFSNFDDYDLNGYQGIQGRQQLHVISSKGCVRKCDFCDVAVQFKRFSNKDGKRMAEEVIFLSEKYNITDFATADSIINGNLKSLRETLEVLAEYNDQRSEEKKIKWGGNWICRPPGRISSEFFELMFRAGCRHLTIGAEHGSDAVLMAMDKKTNVAGLFYEIDQMFQKGIQCSLNNIIGHWAETFDDFTNHIDMILKLGPYFANKTITQLNISSFMVLAGTPAILNQETNGLQTQDDNFSLVWYTPKNANLTPKTRIARLYIFFHMCYYLGIPVPYGYQLLFHLRNRFQDLIEEFEDFLSDKINLDDYQSCQSLTMLDNWKEYLGERIKKIYPDLNLKLKIQSSSCKGNPTLYVRYNKKTLYQKELGDGEHEIDLKFDNEFDSNNIEIGMLNKNKNDTIVDSEGKIIKDKNIKFLSVQLDGIDLLEDKEYFYKNLNYTVDDEKDKVHDGLYFPNSKLSIDFKDSFWQTYWKIRTPGLTYLQTNVDEEKHYQLLEDLKRSAWLYKY